jgi:hypothetical protein
MKFLLIISGKHLIVYFKLQNIGLREQCLCLLLIPGVGSARKSVVLKTKSGHFFVGPDNGQLTLVAESLGIDS